MQSSTINVTQGKCFVFITRTINILSHYTHLMNSSLTIACKAWTQRGHCVGTACYVRVVHCTCTLCVCNAAIPLIGSVVPLLWMRPCLINNITILRKPKETSHHLNSGRKECKFRFTASKFDNLKKAKKGVMKSLQLTTSMQTCSS